MSFVSIVCAHCGKTVRRHNQAKFCFDCTLARRQPLAGRASSKVSVAVKNGKLAPVKDCTCVDCGEPAVDYDHRDYEKPLDVEPVCRSCNCKRGAAHPYREDYSD